MLDNYSGVTLLLEAPIIGLIIVEMKYVLSSVTFSLKTKVLEKFRDVLKEVVADANEQ